MLREHSTCMGPRKQSNNNKNVILLSVPCLYYDSDWSGMTSCISMISSRTNQNNFLTQLHTQLSRLKLGVRLLHAMSFVLVTSRLSETQLSADLSSIHTNDLRQLQSITLQINCKTLHII